MRFRIEDREYEFDGEYTVDEAMLFFDKASVGVAELQAALIRGNPYVVATMMYILKKRAGEAVRWQDMGAFPITALQFIPEETDLPTEEVKEADPTQNGGPTLEAATTAT